MSASAVSTAVADFIRRMPIFSDLSEASFETLSRSGKSLLKEKGQFIFYQGDPSETFFIVKSGQVSILLESADGREMVINAIQPGDFFGELGLITKKARSTSAVARKDTELLAIPRQTFLAILDVEPGLTRRMLEITADRLRWSSERESALAFLDAQARLARLLLNLDQQEEEKGYITISQGELAQRTGLTRQTVAKALGRWRRAGWLITGRGHILLLKHDELSSIKEVML